MENNKLNFRVSSHLKDIIGKDLVTDKYVAIFELVKNSVDAKAKNIEVRIDQDQIIIKDDGQGMTLEDIQNKWFFIGYSEKRDSKVMYAGSKGIGRFSADNLAKELKIETKDKSNNTIEIEIDWELFEHNQNDEINDVRIPFKELLGSRETGTVLTLKKLRNPWNKDNIIKLKRALEKIENPFEEKKIVKITLITEYSELNGVIKNNLLKVLDEKSIVMTVTIKDSIFNCILKHNGKNVATFTYIQETVLENVSFKIYHLTTSAKINFTKRMGLAFTNYGNIFVYRNGFRVYPYGEIDFDMFELNLRKTQGYKRYLGARDVIGSISITDLDNRFKEVSSRDNGFVANQSYLELKNIYMEYHKFLEDFMKVTLFNTTINYEISEKLIKRFQKKDEFNFELGKNENYVKFEDIIHKIEKDIPLSIHEKKIIKDENRKNKLEFREIKDVKKENKNLQKKNIDLKKEIAIKNILINTDDENISVDREMFNHHINTEINELKAIMENYREENEGIINNSSFLEFEAQYFEIIQKLIAIKNIIFSVKEKSIGKIENNIVQFIEEYSKKWSMKNKLTIEVFTNNNSFQKKYDIIYLVIVLDNIFENAVKNNARKIEILVENINQELIIDFISRKSANDNIVIDKVFDFGYTTKKRGTGMGMFFVKKIIEEQLKSSVSVDIINGEDFVTKIKMG